MRALGVVSKPLVGTFLTSSLVALTCAVAPLPAAPQRAPETPKAPKTKVIDRKFFYDTIREALCHKAAYSKPCVGRLDPVHVETFSEFFDYWDGRADLTDLRWLAYILASAYHESGFLTQPIRETFADTDEEAVERLAAAYRKGLIKRKYWVRAENGKSYYGRGFVQLTWDFNYKRVGQALGLDDELYDRPDRQLERKIAMRTIIEGMIDGVYTPGHHLPRYFPPGVDVVTSNWVKARKIVNGLDRADQIADYGLTFLGALRLVEAHRRVEAAPGPWYARWLRLWKGFWNDLWRSDR